MEENIEITYPVKTGECKFKDEEGNLCLAESFENELGEVTTKITILEEALKEEEVV